MQPKSSVDLHQHSSAKARLVGTTSQTHLPSALNAIEFVPLPRFAFKQRLSTVTNADSEIPITIGLFSTLKDSVPMDTYKFRKVFPRKASISPRKFKTNRPERLVSNFIEDKQSAFELKYVRKLPTLAHYKMPVSFSKIHQEKNAGFRLPGKREPTPKLKLNSGRATEKSGKTFLNQGEIALFKAVRKIQERVIAQVGSVEDYCARYSLTSVEFSTQLEEFATLAYESSKTGAGVHPELLSNFYNTSIKALSGLSLPEASAKLEGVKTQGLLSWQEFSLYYSLAIAQRALELDILRFLFTLAEINLPSQLKESVCLNALKSKFKAPHKFTSRLQQIWTRLTASVIAALGHGDRREVTTEQLVEAGQTAVPVLELRYLVGEVFVSHIGDSKLSQRTP
jgi:hypothetical protein